MGLILIGLGVSAFLAYTLPYLYLAIALAGTIPTYRMFWQQAILKAGEAVAQEYAEKEIIVKILWVTLNILLWPLLLMCAVVPGAANNFIEGMAEGLRATVEND